MVTLPGRRRWRRGAVLAAAVMVLAAGCGMPDGGPVQRVPDQDVPYGLLVSPTTTSTPGAATVPETSGTSGTTGATSATSATSAIYLVDSGQHLVALPVQLGRATLVPLVQSLLNRLALGPSERERARGLLTDLGPGASFSLRAVRNGTAVIQLRTASQDPSPVKLPVAIGQVVMTATSVEGVDQVLFVLDDGSPVSVPSPPAGDLSSAPLVRQDYQLLLAPGQTPAGKTQPVPSTEAAPGGATPSPSS